jgi:hypothetical protein
MIRVSKQVQFTLLQHSKFKLIIVSQTTNAHRFYQSGYHKVEIKNRAIWPRPMLLHDVNTTAWDEVRTLSLCFSVDYIVARHTIQWYV